MRIGIYFDLRNPPEWQRSPAALYADAIDLAMRPLDFDDGVAPGWELEHLHDDG